MTDSAVPADEFKSKRPNSERAGFVFRAGRPLNSPGGPKRNQRRFLSHGGRQGFVNLRARIFRNSHYDCLAPPNEAKDDKTRGSKDDPAAVGMDPE
jgi:hypothetical protein